MADGIEDSSMVLNERVKFDEMTECMLKDANETDA